MTEFIHDLRVYYEDTDLAGIVYYANYLKFIERGRSEMLRALGIDQTRLKAEQGIVFAVRAVNGTWLAPARFDDALRVVTRPLSVTGARLVMNQQVKRGAQVLFEAEVEVVAMTLAGRAVRVPADVRALFFSASAVTP